MTPTVRASCDYCRKHSKIWPVKDGAWDTPRKDAKKWWDTHNKVCKLRVAEYYYTATCSAPDCDSNGEDLRSPVRRVETLVRDFDDLDCDMENHGEVIALVWKKVAARVKRGADKVG